MTTELPTAVAAGVSVAIAGAGTVSVTALLGCVPTSRVTGPVVAPSGTGTTMLVALQVVGGIATPLSRTVLVPWVAPKVVPVMVIAVPDAPAVGKRLVMTGGGDTVKATALLAIPFTVTTTVPVVAVAGTGTTMLVLLQVVGVASVPLNCTVLVPLVAPKFVPVIVIGTPKVPDVGDRLVMDGGSPTVNVTALLARPPTVT